MYIGRKLYWQGWEVYHSPVSDGIALMHPYNKVLFTRDNKTISLLFLFFDSYCYLPPSSGKDCIFWLHVLVSVMVVGHVHLLFPYAFLSVPFSCSILFFSPFLFPLLSFDKVVHRSNSTISLPLNQSVQSAQPDQSASHMIVNNTVP